MHVMAASTAFHCMPFCLAWHPKMQMSSKCAWTSGGGGFVPAGWTMICRGTSSQATVLVASSKHVRASCRVQLHANAFTGSFEGSGPSSGAVRVSLPAPLHAFKATPSAATEMIFRDVLCKRKAIRCKTARLHRRSAMSTQWRNVGSINHTPLSRYG